MLSVLAYVRSSDGGGGDNSLVNQGIEIMKITLSFNSEICVHEFIVTMLKSVDFFEVMRTLFYICHVRFEINYITMKKSG